MLHLHCQRHQPSPGPFLTNTFSSCPSKLLSSRHLHLALPDYHFYTLTLRTSHFSSPFLFSPILFFFIYLHIQSSYSVLHLDCQNFILFYTLLSHLYLFFASNFLLFLSTKNSFTHIFHHPFYTSTIITCYFF